MSIYTGGMVYQSVGMAGKWSFKGCPITHCSSQITLTRLVNMIASAQPSSPSYYIYIPQNSAFMHCICILYRVQYGVYIFTELGALNVYTPARAEAKVVCIARLGSTVLPVTDCWDCVLSHWTCHVMRFAHNNDSWATRQTALVDCRNHKLVP